MASLGRIEKGAERRKGSAGSRFRNGDVLFPRKKFEVAIKPMFQQVLALARANALLSSARGRLLPRLISGRVGVVAVGDAEERTKRTKRTAE
jgi:hypothetical protein